MDIKNNGNILSAAKMRFANKLEEVRLENSENQDKMIEEFDVKLRGEQRKLKNDRIHSLDSQKRDYEVKLKEQAYKFGNQKRSIIEDHKSEIDNMKKIYAENLNRMVDQRKHLLRRKSEELDGKVDNAVFNEKTKMDSVLTKRLKLISQDFDKNLQKEKEINYLQRTNAQNKYNNNLKRVESTSRINESRQNRRLKSAIIDHKEQREDLVTNYEDVIKNQKGY